MPALTPEFGAVVTIVDLPLATTLSSAAVFEAVQTTDGVVESVKVTLNQIVTASFGGLPAGGATGQLLTKSGAADFTTAWSNISSLIAANATSGIVIDGSTTLAVALSSVAGLSVLGVAGTATAIPLPIAAASGAQVLRANDAGTGVAFGAVNLASAAAVTGVLPNANMSAVNLATALAGGVQGILPVLNGGIGTASVATNGLVIGAGTAALTVVAATTSGLFLQSQGTAAAPIWTSSVGMVLLNTISPNNVATAGDTTSFTASFRNYMVTLENVCPATQTTTLQMQVATTGTAFISGGYVAMVALDVGAGFVSDTSTTAILLSGTRVTTQLQTSTSYGFNGFIKLFNPLSSTFRKMIIGEGNYLTPGASGTATLANAMIGGYYDGSNSPVTGISFLFDSGNIQTGTIKVYGLP